jgi:hypothetical protein
MVCFQTQNPNLGKFWRVLLLKILVYFMTIWSILGPLEIFHGHLVYFVVIWYIFPHFGVLDQEKSGNSAPTHFLRTGLRIVELMTLKSCKQFRCSQKLTAMYIHVTLMLLLMFSKTASYLHRHNIYDN